MKGVQNLACGADMRRQIAFRELESQKSGWQPRILEDVGDVLDEERIVQHRRSKVYAHVETLVRLRKSTPLGA